MRALPVVVGTLIVAAVAGIGAISIRVPPAAASAPAPAGPATPILVELFTSEGCSSCPSADAVVARLESAQPVPGARVIVLAHHVDYWNQLGWPDPWSSPAATARQRSYASLKSGSYTPQAVVDGRAEMVGSRAAAIEQAVASAAKEPHAKVEIDVAAVASEKDTFDVTVKGALPADAGFYVAVVQARGRVAVPRGENAGQTLDHTAIVRSLAAVDAAGRTRVTVPAAIDAPQGTAFSVVAFAQEKASRKIVGAAERPLAASR